MSGATQIEQDAGTVLRCLAQYEAEHREQTTIFLGSKELTEKTGLDPARLNDAVEILVANRYVDVMRVLGSAPFTFGWVRLLARGKLEAQRLASATSADQRAEASTTGISRSPIPVGSPYGFTVQDWELVELARKRTGELKVVMGLAFESPTYSKDELIGNMKKDFEAAVERYNAKYPREKISLDFKALSAGYGEHLFNQIARDIISADVAVFETSDMNPNVMIEMGVALTWGTRVHPIKREGKPKPPSDISGQTWTDYKDDGTEFVDPENRTKLDTMIELAMRKKTAAAQL